MNRGTPRNILIELNMTTDDYNFVSTVYYVGFIFGPRLPMLKQAHLDTVHCLRDTIQFDHEENAPFQISGENNGS